VSAAAEKALQRIVTLCREPNHRVSRQFRLLEIALEGLGIPAKYRHAEVQRVIQERRDRLQQHIAGAVKVGGPDAHP
jgi:hypothetical protein